MNESAKQSTALESPNSNNNYKIRNTWLTWLTESISFLCSFVSSSRLSFSEEENQVLLNSCLVAATQSGDRVTISRAKRSALSWGSSATLVSQSVSQLPVMICQSVAGIQIYTHLLRNKTVLLCFQTTEHSSSHSELFGHIHGDEFAQSERDAHVWYQPLGVKKKYKSSYKVGRLRYSSSLWLKIWVSSN